MHTEVTRRSAIGGLCKVVATLATAGAAGCSRRGEQAEIQSLREIAASFEALQQAIKGSNFTNSPAAIGAAGAKIDQLRAKLWTLSDKLGVLPATSYKQESIFPGVQNTPHQNLILTVTGCSVLSQQIVNRGRSNQVVDREAFKFLLQKTGEAQIACRLMLATGPTNK